MDGAKKSATDAINTASKRAFKKTVEAAGDLISSEIADKITSASAEFYLKKSSKKLPSNEANNERPKERFKSQQER